MKLEPVSGCRQDQASRRVFRMSRIGHEESFDTTAYIDDIGFRRRNARFLRRGTCFPPQDMRSSNRVVHNTTN
jgi:hypothetical protein